MVCGQYGSRNGLPAPSPDLNPTEHLWDELERQLRSRPQRPTSLTALATALQEEWAAIPLETFCWKVSPVELELS
jgi:transposase